MVSTGDPTPTVATETSTGGAKSGTTGELVVGTVFDRYTILEQVGAGGMGEVYAAYDSKLDRKIALKLLRRSSEELEARLMREAQAMARLAHPNVVSVFDTGHVDEKLYLAMEFVRGETLRKWQKAAPRSLAELLRVYTEAGHGLAAAHAAGLVHRDFKPDNVLVAEDGRIKVTDFGIARAQEEKPSAGPSAVKLRSSRPPPSTEDGPPLTGRTPTTGALDSPVTQEGTLLGTPGYMAPEQLLCEPLDARTDQFAFCVSLYEALYREKPFGKNTRGFDEVAEATLTGTVNEPPKGTTVPAHVRRVLLRGLAPEREARYSSMHELLADLARDPTRKRRRAFTAAATLLTAAALLTTGVVQYRRAATGRALVCKGSEEALHGIWDDAKKQQLRQAFLATGSPIAADTWSRVERTVDGYASEWVGMRTEACESTRVRGLQSDEAMTLRMACLDRRLGGVKAFVDVFTTPDAASVAQAARAALSLTPIAGCADLVALRMPIPLPEDPAARAKVEALRPKAAELKALFDAGKYKTAIQRAEPALQAAAEVRYRPVEAELHFWAGKAYGRTGEFKESETESLQALWAAEAGGHQEIAALASCDVAFAMGEVARWQEAEHWLDHGQAVLEHMGGNVDIEVRLEKARGDARIHKNPPDALRHYERSRELLERSPTTRPELGAVYNNMGAAHDDLGDYDKAAEHYLRSVAVIEKTLGPDHPTLSHPNANLAGAYSRLGRYDDAERYAARCRQLPSNGGAAGTVSEALGLVHMARGRYQEALASFENAERQTAASTGDNNPYLTAGILSDEGLALSQLGRHKEALERTRRAVDLRESHFDANPKLRAEGYTALGWALRAAGHPDEALGYHQKALAIYSAASHPYAADALTGTGYDHLDAGRFAEALSAFREAVRVKESRSEKEHPGLAAILTGVARAEIASGRPADAISPVTRALAIAERARLAPRVLGEARFTLAQATWETGGSHEAAREIALAAKADAERAEGDHTTLKKQLDAWLAAHP